MSPAGLPLHNYGFPQEPAQAAQLCGPSGSGGLCAYRAVTQSLQVREACYELLSQLGRSRDASFCEGDERHVLRLGSIDDARAAATLAGARALLKFGQFCALLALAAMLLLVRRPHQAPTQQSRVGQHTLF